MQNTGKYIVQPQFNRYVKDKIKKKSQQNEKRQCKAKWKKKVKITLKPVLPFVAHILILTLSKRKVKKTFAHRNLPYPFYLVWHRGNME